VQHVDIKAVYVNVRVFNQPIINREASANYTLFYQSNCSIMQFPLINAKTNSLDCQNIRKTQTWTSH